MRTSTEPVRANRVRIRSLVLIRSCSGFSAQQEEKRKAMKAAKKARQRKRRAAVKAKSQRRAVASEDRSFGAAIAVAERRRYPPMEWSGTTFSPTKPKPPPTLDVNVTIMREAHAKCGIRWSGSHKGSFESHSVEAYADTCCQTFDIKFVQLSFRQVIFALRK